LGGGEGERVRKWVEARLEMHREQKKTLSKKKKKKKPPPRPQGVIAVHWGSLAPLRPLVTLGTEIIKGRVKLVKSGGQGLGGGSGHDGADEFLRKERGACGERRTRKGTLPREHQTCFFPKQHQGAWAKPKPQKTTRKTRSHHQKSRALELRIKGGGGGPVSGRIGWWAVYSVSALRAVNDLATVVQPAGVKGLVKAGRN